MGAQKPLIVFGGNGFVGSAVCAAAVARDVPVVSVSRSGAPPPQTKPGSGGWADRVRWEKGDALEPASYKALLGGAGAVVVALGSPPLPFVDRALQRRMNGETNAAVAAAAAEAGVPRLVMVNAAMPAWLDRVAPGYAEGKREAAAAAEAFLREGGAGAHAAVLKPSVIYGTRYERSPVGPLPLPLGAVFGPLSWGLRAFSGTARAMRQAAPSALDGLLHAPVSVHAVANAALHHALDADPAAAGGKVAVEDPDALVRFTPKWG